MRQYQEWTRAEITSEFKRLDEAKLHLDRKIQEFKTMPISIEDLRGQSQMDVDDPEFRRMVVSMRRTSLVSAALDEHIACSKTQQQLDVELHIRNDPKLVAELGPGRD